MIQSKSSNKKKFFEDRAGVAAKPGLVYDAQNFRYIVDNVLTKKVSTAATQRLGVVNATKELHVKKHLENVGYPVGGINIGAVTVFTGSISEQSAEDLIDFYRSGKNISNIKQFSRATTTIPMIRVSPDNFFEDNALGTIDHSLNFNVYGQGYLFLDVDESPVNQKIIPFNDFGKIDPVKYVETDTLGFPFVHNVRKNYNQFVDPTDLGINGAIDVFEVRQSMANLSINDISIRGIKGNLQGGAIEDLRKGSTEILGVIEYNKNRLTEAFEDSQDILFSSFSFQKKGLDVRTGTEDKKYTLPGIVGNDKYKIFPYKDVVARDKFVNSYSFLNGGQKDTLLSGSSASRSEIGQRFKSATNGLIFGESNVLGTDSIAFGGFLK